MICEILGAVNCFAICLLAESSRVLALVDPMWTLAAVWSVGIMGMASAVKRRQ